MKRINIIGPIFGTDGYVSHTENLSNALNKIADCRLTTQLPAGWNLSVSDAQLQMITKQGKEDDINLIIARPDTWKMFLGLGMNIGYCVWEGDSVPVSYIDEILNPKIDLVFVPSKHTEQAIWNTMGRINADLHLADNKSNSEILYKKLRVIPHGVDLTKFYPKEKPNDGIFRFISTKGWRGTSWDRGGVQYLIQAFAEEFKKNEKVELLIKLNPAYITPDILNKVISEMKLPEDRPRINVCLDSTKYDKLVDFYNKGDVFVCATRCEAFNLPGIEAMACGLPTIQTNFGGQIDYMNKENALFINYTLGLSEEPLMYEGIKWAIPDKEELKKHLRWSFENQDKIKEMSKKALEDVKNWTWDKSAEKVISAISSISD